MWIEHDMGNLCDIREYQGGGGVVWQRGMRGLVDGILAALVHHV